jgi:hypothetical protein
MSGPCLWTFPSPEGAILMATKLRARHGTFNYLVEKPKFCIHWRIAIIDVHTGQRLGHVKA